MQCWCDTCGTDWLFSTVARHRERHLAWHRASSPTPTVGRLMFDWGAKRLALSPTRKWLIARPNALGSRYIMLTLKQYFPAE